MFRLKSIDFLRGIAVILVLFRHHLFFKPLNLAGWIGVDLFFVLSGYLISTLLFKEFIAYGKIKPIRFLIRRGFKIYPLFYTAILLTLILDYIKGHPINYYNLISEIFFMQNYFGSMWNHTWSIAIEEHFYFGLAILLFIATTLNLIRFKISMILCFFGIFIFCLYLRVNNIHSEYTFKTHLFPTHLRIDSLLFGVFISFLCIFYKEFFERFILKYKKLLIVISFLLIFPSFIFSVNTIYMSTIGLTQLYIGFGIILSVFLIEPNIDFVLKKYIGKHVVNLVAFIGIYSYGIYLFHMFLIRYLFDFIHKFGVELNFRVEFVLYFALSIFFGVIMTKLIEKPFLGFRDKLFPRPVSIKI